MKRLSPEELELANRAAGGRLAEMVFADMPWAGEAEIEDVLKAIEPNMRRLITENGGGSVEYILARAQTAAEMMRVLEVLRKRSGGAG